MHRGIFSAFDRRRYCKLNPLYGLFIFNFMKLLFKINLYTKGALHLPINVRFLQVLFRNMYVYEVLVLCKLDDLLHSSTIPSCCFFLCIYLYGNLYAVWHLLFMW